MAAIVGSSNFTAPGLLSNRELNLSHKVLLEPEEANDPEAALAVKYLAEQAGNERITPRNRQLLKSEVGARAIIELERWFLRQWEASRDFKEELIALLDASKFGRVEYTPWQVYLKGHDLTDRLAYAHTSFIKNAAPLMGRNVTVGVRVAF